MTDQRAGQFLITILCLFLLGGCTKRASEEIDLGAVENAVYRSQYFGLSLTLPAEWSVQDESMRQKLVQTGTKMMFDGDKRMKTALKLSEQQTVNLLAAFKHPIGTPVPFNPSIMCVAERVRG